MSFIDDLAHKSPVPGGGAAAARCAALGAALLHKIVKVLETKSPDESLPSWGNLREKLISLRETFSRLEKEDSESYRALSRELQGGNGADRDQAVQGSLDPPLRIMEYAFETLQLLHQAHIEGPRYVFPDLLVCVELLAAAHNGAAAIAGSNTRLFNDRRTARRIDDRIADRTFEFTALQKTVTESLSVT